MMEYKVEMLERRAWRPASALFGGTYSKAVKSMADADAILRTVKESWEGWTDEELKKLRVYRPSKYRIVSRMVTEWEISYEAED